jgi:hypothetical protein
MNKEPMSRIAKIHPEVIADADSSDREVEVDNLAALLKKVLLRNEDDLKAITSWIQSKKRLLNEEASTLDVNDAKRKVLLDEVNHLEALRQQLLATFVGQQASYQSLMNAEQELKKRYNEEKEPDNKPHPAPVLPEPVLNKVARKKKRQASRTR